MMLRHQLILSLIALLMGGLVACEDNAKRPTTAGDPVPRDMDPPIAGNMEQDMGGTMVDPPKASRELRTLPGESTTRTIFLNDMVSLQAQYLMIDGGNEVGIANQPLTLRLLDADGADRTAAGIMGSRLQSSRVNTNAQGIGTFNLFAGDIETSFRIEVSAADAPSISFTINVVRPGTGDLTVRVHYDLPNGRYTYPQLSTASVSLFANRDCDLIISDATRLGGAYFAFPDINPYSDVRNSTSADNFEHGATFTVAASLRNENGQAIAFGCVEDVLVEGGLTTEVDIDAVDLPMELKGKFVTMNRFDLTDLLRSSDNESLIIVSDILEVLRLVGSEDPNRGDAIINLICADYLNVDAGTCRIISTIGNAVVISYLDRIPPDVLSVLVVISDVIEIMSDMTIMGEIEFPVNYPDENNMIEAYNRWQSFRFVWRDGCPMGDDCTREFTIGDLDRFARPIEGRFEAQVAGPEMTIFEHGMTFRYGLIALGLIETWLIPAVLGTQVGVPVTLNELLADVFEQTCIDVDQALSNPGFCENVLINAVSAVIVDQLGRLDFEPDQFRLQGRATLVDENIDLRIDQIIDGQWVGQIDTGDFQLEFNGCFVGCRDMECAEPLDSCEIEMWMPQEKSDELVWNFQD